MSGCRWCGRVQCDCRDRFYCQNVGAPGHKQCGVCPDHWEPRFKCGCHTDAETGLVEAPAKPSGRP